MNRTPLHSKTFLATPINGANSMANSMDARSRGDISTLTLSPASAGHNPGAATVAGGAAGSAEEGSPSGALTQIDKLRLWRHDAFLQHHHRTASFLGDKIFALTNDAVDAFWLAQAYFNSNQFTRVVDLTTLPAVQSSVSCQYLGALALVRLGDYEKALSIIGEHPASAPTAGSSSFKSSSVGAAAGSANSMADSRSSYRGGDEGIKLDASIAYLRGVIYNHLSNFDLAIKSFKEAVVIDPKCYEALCQLFEHDSLSPKQEVELLESLNFESCCRENADLARLLYSLNMSKYSDPSIFEDVIAQLSDDYGLGENNDVLLARSDMLLVQCRYRECADLCEKIFENDRFKLQVLPNYLTCLHELGARNKLFLIAHDVADKYPEDATAWLAVGVYYLTVGRVSDARKFFSKSSLIDPFSGPAWIGFAHTFAMEGEHEQAISSYSTAARLFPGSHLPQLFLGMQHLHLHSFNLASEFLAVAYEICQSDPLLLNELGVVHYQKQELRSAEQYFLRALDTAHLMKNDQRAWSSVHVNLGHVYRRLGQYDKSLECFETILRITPRDVNIHSALGLVYLQAGKTVLAIEHLHSALAIAPADVVVQDLLKRALEANARADEHDVFGLMGLAVADADALDILDLSDTEASAPKLLPASPEQFYGKADDMELE